MNQYSNLKLQALAIGSLPHNDLTKAMNVVKKRFSANPIFSTIKKYQQKRRHDYPISGGIAFVFAI